MRRFHRDMDGCQACRPTRNGILVPLSPCKRVPDCTDHHRARQPLLRRIVSACFFNHLLAALISQSCFSCPSCGQINSGSSAITWFCSWWTITGVRTLWKHSVFPLPRSRWEQFWQWICWEQKYSSHRWRSKVALLHHDIDPAARLLPSHETRAPMSGSMPPDLRYPGACGFGCHSISFDSKTNSGHWIVLWAGWLGKENRECRHASVCNLILPVMSPAMVGGGFHILA